MTDLSLLDLPFKELKRKALNHFFFYTPQPQQGQFQGARLSVKERGFRRENWIGKTPSLIKTKKQHRRLTKRPL